jgi:hypothetical protein
MKGNPLSTSFLEKRSPSTYFVAIKRLEAQKTFFPNHPFRMVACLAAVISSQEHYTEILCKRISWIVAQTIARQLVSVVNTSI